LEALLQLVENEHRPHLPLAFHLLDHLLFRSQGLFPQIASLIFLAAVAFLAVRALAGAADGAGRMPSLARRLAAAGLLLALLFSPYHYENLIWPKELHVYLSLLLAVSAFTLATAPGAPAPGRTAALCALLFGACFSFAAGFV